MEATVNPEPNAQIQVLSDLEAVSHQAAFIFADISRNSIAVKGRFAVALSGGSTPKRFYTLLGFDPYRSKVEWNHVHFFWADERCVPKEDEESNFGLAYEAFLSKIPVPASNIHRVKGEEDPEKAAKDYEDDMKKFFGMSGIPVFDLIILGIGKDGHTASLFAGSKSLKKTIRLAVPAYVKRPRPKRARVTLTLPVLNNAAQILFLVSGRSKATIVHEVLGKEKTKDQYPAGLINPSRGSIIWLVDREAAARLKGISHDASTRVERLHW